MSEENGGKDPMPAPPSFIPSAGRKKTESQPHKSTIPSQSGSPSIPSFSPAAQPSRSSAPHASRRTAQPSSVTPSGSSVPQSSGRASGWANDVRKQPQTPPADHVSRHHRLLHRLLLLQLRTITVRLSRYEDPPPYPLACHEQRDRTRPDNLCPAIAQQDSNPLRKPCSPTENDIWGGSFSRFSLL